jgi:carboxynorspermidine decarboxylase
MQQLLSRVRERSDPRPKGVAGEGLGMKFERRILEATPKRFTKVAKVVGQIMQDADGDIFEIEIVSAIKYLVSIDALESAGNIDNIRSSEIRRLIEPRDLESVSAKAKEALAEDSRSFQTPCFVLDTARLRQNLETAKRVREEAGCKILLATKAFAMPAAFPLMRDYLDGTTASGEQEAIMGHAEFGKEVHVYSPAYTEDEVRRLTEVAQHIYFNSAEQLARFGDIARDAGCHVGLRVNPGYSNATLGGDLYNPTAPTSRFGEVPEKLAQVDWSGVDIFHVHALCESLHEGSVGLIEYVSEHFAAYIGQVKAVNFGGGHFLNKPGYNVDKLIAAIKAFKARFGVEVILEPGAGLVVNTGELYATVLALHWNAMDLAILDASASTHMPDVLEVPYRPDVIGAGQPGEHPHTYRFGGKTCMTGDIIGDYSFEKPLQPGDEIIFTDQMHYAFVKTNTFNGTPLANLAIRWEDGRVEMISDFGYEEFRRRLGR